MQAHDKLDQIFECVWTQIAPRGSPIELVFRLVLFHQSLKGSDSFPNMVVLKLSERVKFVYDEDNAFLPLMKLVMICDDISYSLILDDDNIKEE